MKKLVKKAGRGLGRAGEALHKQLFRRGGGRRYASRLRGEIGILHGFSGRMIVDLSVISQHDAGTGIQRVVRAIAFQLTENRGSVPFEILFVASRNLKHYKIDISANGDVVIGEAISYAAGDLFLGLDFALDTLWQMRRQLVDMRRAGVRFWYLIYDFLPLTQPQWFSRPLVLRFWNWLAIMAGTADGFFCISQPVADQVSQIMRSQFGLAHCPPVVVMPMGWDLAGSRPSSGLPDGFDRLLAQLSSEPALLQVGTIEPRKGHADSLAAMELLWQNGSSLQLVLVGGAGWKMDAFIARLQAHPEYGRRLHWTGRISDEALDRLYATAIGSIFPSLAEGFGLPVVEALAHGRPVLARRLNVLAPLEGQGVTLFDTDASPATLAGHILQWLDGPARHPPVTPASRTTWRDAGDFIMQQMADQRIERK
jgi:glycosyltransferase involved in cell wall biosynthesis